LSKCFLKRHDKYRAEYKHLPYKIISEKNVQSVHSVCLMKNQRLKQDDQQNDQ